MTEREEFCQRLELWARRIGKNHSMYDGRGSQPARSLGEDLLQAVEYIRDGAVWTIEDKIDTESRKPIEADIDPSA